MRRDDNRGFNKLRKLKIIRNYNRYAEGSCLIELGNTRIVCTASVEDRVPLFLRGTGSGWVTAEYGMIPRATQTRTLREAGRGRLGGRTHEIQRLIGRSLRAVTELENLGERTIWVDCDVIQADGGTRTAGITGGFIALADCLKKIKKEGTIRKLGLRDFVAATSVGIVNGKAMLDLSYAEDSRAEVDMNMVMTAAGKIVEIQGTAEKSPFSKSQLDELISLAKIGINKLISKQKELIAELE
jgi:ribonuclease PH